MSQQTLAIIDYGMGNLHSAHKALEHVAARSHTDTKIIVSHDRKEILAADRVLLPGVGAIRDCMGEIRNRGFDETILECIKSKPFLGICVGLQALMTHSEENNGVECLNVFNGEVKHFDRSLEKVPHMGWNTVTQKTENGHSHPLWENISDESRFYFVHSYFVEAQDASETIGSCAYGPRFTAAIARGYIAAVQFHPEKSADAGLQLLENFLHWQP